MNAYVSLTKFKGAGILGVSGEDELISFADGERIMTSIPTEKRNRLKAKKGDMKRKVAYGME